ncbi:hypothetical protein HK102_005276 [Quaeritorhiza haematococci]|nr:hypothetical protein HK102_005276 [Quaeritorhiza haematococci]
MEKKNFLKHLQTKHLQTKYQTKYEMVGEPNDLNQILLDPVAVNRARNQLGFLLSDLRIRGHKPAVSNEQPGAFYVWTYFPNMVVPHDVFVFDLAYLMYTPPKHLLEKIQSILKSIGIVVHWRNLGAQVTPPFSITKKKAGQLK